MSVSLPVVTTSGGSPTGLAAVGTIPAPVPAYLNQSVSIASLKYITAEINNNDPAAYVQASSGITLGAYTQGNSAHIQSALSAFITAAGYPWIAFGDLSQMPWSNGTNGILAVNLGQDALLSIADTGTGLRFFGLSQYSTFGYSPWSDYASARAGLWAMVSNTSWSPAS